MSLTGYPSVVTAVQNYVRYLQRLGVTELPIVLPTAHPEMPTDVSRPGVASSEPLSGPTAAERLAQLEDKVRHCHDCSLHTSRTQVVFGTGDPAADLVFIGEAPGQEEDIQGKPFVGKSGRLLTRIIEAIGLKREQVYILNVLKCRPPDNRNPLPAEVAACRPIIREQLAYLQPQVICALGSFAAQALLETEETISRLRGRFHKLGDMQVMPTFHPAYLLRNPQHRRLVWEDMQRIQQVLEASVGV